MIKLLQFMWNRHRIYLRKEAGEPKPWTNNPIFQRYKFCNVFRQLDTGTVVLHKLLGKCNTPDTIIFNIIWYRMFNWRENANVYIESGTIPYCVGCVEEHIRNRDKHGEKIFTGAHMLSGVKGERKIDSFFHTLHAICYTDLVSLCNDTNCMETVFLHLVEYPLIGKFLAYEMVCDLRYTILLHHATDKMKWGNIGPGAKRGLQRLGMPVKIDSMRNLLTGAQSICTTPDWFPAHKLELREIEHNLCEFDKYERVRLGEGRPRENYPGV